MADPTARGINARLSIQDEAEWGVENPTPAAFRLPLIRLTGDWYTRNLIQSNILCGNRNPTRPVRGNVSVNGGAVVGLELKSAGHWLKHGVGVPVTQADTPSPGSHTHTFKSGFNGAALGSLPPGASFEHAFPDLATPAYFKYLGGRIDSIAINPAAEGVVEVELGIMGKGLAVDTAAPLDPSTTEYPCVALDHFVGEIEEDGSKLGNVTAATFAINNGHAGNYGVGGAGELIELPEQVIGIAGSLTTLFRDLALWTKALAHAETNLRLKWVIDATNQLDLYMPEVVLEPSGPEVTGPAGVIQTFNFQAYYEDSADGAGLVATLINDVASY